jgi:muramoyltetrapeptide carboxypeptidase LdcA involved in peptidoglycan recycling
MSSPLCRPGDRVAVLSPSWGGPAAFPAVHELGLSRLRAMGLEPVELPTTRAADASPQGRARDLVAVMADDDLRAVVCTIGGDDLLTVLPHLDDDVLRDNPKRVVGYSDATNLLHHLWSLGIDGVHGGALMVQWGRPGGMHPVTEASLRWALLEGGEHEVPQPGTVDRRIRWHEADLDVEPVAEPAAPWQWSGPPHVARGPLVGGCLEVVEGLAVADRLLPVERYAGCVLLLETSEEQPAADAVFRSLRNLGERGLLGQAAALVMGRPDTSVPAGPACRTEAEQAQGDAVLRVVATYAPGIPVVLGPDVGHTDPQVVLPYGGAVTVAGAGRRLLADYGG